MKKLLGSLGIIAALGAGAFAISAVLPAGAQSPAPTTPPMSSDGPCAGGGGHGHGQAAKDALDGLVQSGVITQDQEGAVIEALKDALKPDAGKGDGPKGGGFLRHPKARIAGGMLDV